VENEYVARGEVLNSGGPPVWEAFMDELRETHLGPQARRQPAPGGPTVTARMQAAYAAALDREAGGPGTGPGRPDAGGNGPVTG
jgi:hypothetical protein